MIDLPFKDIFEIFLKRYVNDFGEVKAREVLMKVNSSKKINALLDKIYFANVTPTSMDIIATLNAISYFVFSKGETLCLGSLTTVRLWFESVDKDNSSTSAEMFSKLAADIIYGCNRTKFNRADNLFTRFYNDLESNIKTQETKKIIQAADKNYVAFLIRKSSGPFEYPFNIDPNYNYIELQLQFDEEIYFLKKQIPFDHYEEDLDEFKANKTYIINITNYKIEHRNGIRWLIKNEEPTTFGHSDNSTYGSPSDIEELTPQKKLLKLKVSKISSKPTKNGNYIHTLKTDGKKVNILGIEKQSGVLTFFIALPTEAIVGSEHEIDMNMFRVEERPFEITNATGEVQTLMLKWLVIK